MQQHPLKSRGDKTPLELFLVGAQGLPPPLRALLIADQTGAASIVSQ
jgi:hypothetical protein